MIQRHKKKQSVDIDFNEHEGVLKVQYSKEIGQIKEEIPHPHR